MKKVLSILLIAAAAFGFYGGAVSINDVLDSKAYWEEEGKKTTKDLNTLEDGLNELKANTAAYKDGLKTYNEGQIALANGEKEYAAGKAEYAAGVESYKSAPAQIAAGEKELKVNRAKLDGLGQLLTGIGGLNQLGSTWTTSRFVPIAGVDETSGAFYEAMAEFGIVAQNAAEKSQELGLAVNNMITGISSATIPGTETPIPYTALAKQYASLGDSESDFSKLLANLNVASVDTTTLMSKITDFVGLYQAASPEHPDNGTLVATTAGVVQSILSNDDIKAVLPADKAAMLDNFSTPEKIKGLPIEVIYGGLKLLAGELTPQLEATKAEGEIAYRAGEAKLAQAKEDYKNAPAKLASAEKQLAAAEVQLADGRAQLADGKKKLDQYRDGEKTLREGLATLMGTKADPGLKSIAARVGENETFTGVDGFFNFDAGYKGLKAGRAYQDDSGVVITKELTSRAIGFGVGIGAGVVALLAAILGLLKKNKGAAVAGLIAAAAAGFGAYYVKAAGTFYTEGAGSTVGNMPMIAMCVLAGVAVIFAIANLAAPKAEVEAKKEV